MASHRHATSAQTAWRHMLDRPSLKSERLVSSLVRHLQSRISTRGECWPSHTFTRSCRRVADVSESASRTLSPALTERAAGRLRLPARRYDKTTSTTQSWKTASRSSWPACPRLPSIEHPGAQTRTGADFNARSHAAPFATRVAPARARVLHATGQRPVSWTGPEVAAQDVESCGTTGPAARPPFREPFDVVVCGGTSGPPRR